jgi:hypothetical protein
VTHPQVDVLSCSALVDKAIAEQIMVAVRLGFAVRNLGRMDHGLAVNPAPMHWLLSRRKRSTDLELASAATSA